MPGPRCHLVTRSIALALNAICGLLLCISFGLTFFDVNVRLGRVLADDTVAAPNMTARVEYGIFQCATQTDGDRYEPPARLLFTHCSPSGQQTASGALVICALLLCIASLLLCILLVVVQASWNEGGDVWVQHEHAASIAFIATQGACLMCVLTSFGLLANWSLALTSGFTRLGSDPFVDINNTWRFAPPPVLPTTKGTDRVVQIESFGAIDALWVLLFAFLCEAVALVLASVPQIIGVDICGMHELPGNEMDSLSGSDVDDASGASDVLEDRVATVEDVVVHFADTTTGSTDAYSAIADGAAADGCARWCGKSIEEAMGSDTAAMRDLTINGDNGYVDPHRGAVCGATETPHEGAEAEPTTVDRWCATTTSTATPAHLTNASAAVVAIAPPQPPTVPPQSLPPTAQCGSDYQYQSSSSNLQPQPPVEPHTLQLGSTSHPLPQPPAPATPTSVDGGFWDSQGDADVDGSGTPLSAFSSATGTDSSTSSDVFRTSRSSRTTGQMVPGLVTILGAGELESDLPHYARTPKARRKRSKREKRERRHHRQHQQDPSSESLDERLGLPPQELEHVPWTPVGVAVPPPVAGPRNDLMETRLRRLSRRSGTDNEEDDDRDDDEVSREEQHRRKRRHRHRNSNGRENGNESSRNPDVLPQTPPSASMIIHHGSDYAGSRSSRGDGRLDTGTGADVAGRRC